MKKYFSFYFICLIIAITFSQTATMPDSPNDSSEKIISRIAFGSCNKQNKEQPLWQDIIACKPQLWVWLGDNIYADTKNMDRMKRKYDRQKDNPDYQKLLEITQVVGIWDDHDYGQNNAGKEYPKKVESQQLFLNFIDEPQESSRWTQEGIFAAYTYGPSGRSIKLILLDVRYHRDTPGPDKDILGDKQWQWLEYELRNNTADITVIASGTQIIPKDYAKKDEVWIDYPRKKDYLFELIGKSVTKGVIFISGDRHFAEISKLDSSAIGYPVYEVTSSGLTETGSPKKKINSLRKGAPYSKQHFGVIEIDWNSTPVAVSLQIRGLQNKVIMEERINLDELHRLERKTTF